MNCKSSIRLLPLMILVLAVSCGRGARSASRVSETERSEALEKLQDSSTVLGEMVRSGSISSDQRRQARCVVVVPSLVSGGLVLGAAHGEGVVTCRAADGWSAPAFVKVAGGSAGLQAGVESADVLMLVKSTRRLAHLFRSDFELGAETSTAAGAVGASSEVSTDATMTTEIVSFARSRGLFAGAELSGTGLRQDRAAAAAVYGGSPDIHGILYGEVQPTVEVKGFIGQMRAAFPPG
jgi:SH3 domain-containing YSC84-like protein 1